MSVSSHIFRTKKLYVSPFQICQLAKWFFSKKDRDDLLSVCASLSARLEREVREFQQKKIRQAATSGFDVLKNGRPEYGILVKYLMHINMTDFMIATFDEHDHAMDVSIVNGLFEKYARVADFQGCKLSLFIRDSQRQGSFHSLIFSKSGGKFVEHRKLKSEIDNHELAEIIVLSVKSVIGYTSLVLIRKGTTEPSIDSEVTGFSKNEEGFLLSLISIYAAANEAGKSVISAEKADHMLADLGHEVGTPVSVLTQTAILACDRALSLAAKLELANGEFEDLTELKSNLNEYKKDVNHTGRLIQIITEIPRSLAQIGTNSVEMDFRTHEWVDLIKDVWRDAKDWSIVLDENGLGMGRVARGSFQLKVSDNLAGRYFVGDRALLRMSIGNVVKNALKYSLSRHRNIPMEIGIFLEPQLGKTFLNVRNWGVGIPKESYRRIFGKYDRIERIDRYQTINGRGIGLYLAKSFIKAHGGDMNAEAVFLRLMTKLELSSWRVMKHNLGCGYLQLLRWGGE